MHLITRRSAMRGLMAAPWLARGEDRSSAFALIGDRYHNSDYMRIGLEKLSGRMPVCPSISATK